MKVSHIGIIAVMLVVIAVALAGCTGSSPATPATGGASSGGAPAAGGAASSGSSQPAGSSSGTGSGALTAASIFGGLNYEWVEYKMVAGEGQDKMTVYYKYNHKTGKCTMRFEMAEKIEGMPTEMDCSAASTTGGKSAGNPNEVDNSVKFIKVGTESVTVPAGTFIADKYQATFEGSTATYWVANGKPLIKMQGASAGEGGAVMELNDWG